MTLANLHPITEAEILHAEGMHFQLKEFTNFLR